MILNEPLSLSPRGLCLERWLDLDRLRSLDVAWPPAVAAGGLATSPSTVDGSGEGPFLAARRLFVGLPVIMRYFTKMGDLSTFNCHVSRLFRWNFDKKRGYPPPNSGPPPTSPCL